MVLILEIGGQQFVAASPVTRKASNVTPCSNTAYPPPIKDWPDFCTIRITNHEPGTATVHPEKGFPKSAQVARLEQCWTVLGEHTPPRYRIRRIQVDEIPFSHRGESLLKISLHKGGSAQMSRCFND